MQGWIKDYRKEIGSDIWMMPPLYHRVWQYLKYTVNHTDRVIPTRNGKVVVKKGQTITSYQSIAEAVAWYEYGIKRVPNKKTIKAILDWLEKEGMIVRESNAKGTVITLCNYCIYQGGEDKESNAEETLEKRSLDTNNNVNNDKKKDSTSSSRKSANSFPDDSPPMILAQKLKSYILANNPNARTPSSLQKWATDFDRMIRLDKRPIPEIEAVMEFSQRDEFWRSNILSAGKLREKYDQLYLQSKRRPRGDPAPRRQFTHVHPVTDLQKVIQRKSMVGIGGGDS